MSGLPNGLGKQPHNLLGPAGKQLTPQVVASALSPFDAGGLEMRGSWMPVASCYPDAAMAPLARMDEVDPPRIQTAMPPHSELQTWTDHTLGLGEARATLVVGASGVGGTELMAATI